MGAHSGVDSGTDIDVTSGTHPAVINKELPLATLRGNQLEGAGLGRAPAALSVAPTGSVPGVVTPSVTIGSVTLT